MKYGANGVFDRLYIKLVEKERDKIFNELMAYPSEWRKAVERVIQLRELE